MGLSLERFDTIGGYRTVDNGEPIDDSAALAGKSFSGATGLGQYIRDNPRYPACVARRLYSYSRGEKSWSVDDFAEAYKAFQASGYRLRALLRGMAVSEAFYAATPPEEPAAAKAREVASK